MIVTAGIDVGSAAVKVTVIESKRNGGRKREGARILSSVTERVRRRDQRDVVKLAYGQALEEAKVHADDVVYLATTGEGEIVEARTGHFYGMTAHARGAIFLDPDASALVDVGALHARAIKMSPVARVLAYRMTSQCASGSGQFLENIARYLGVTLEEIGDLSCRADAPEKVSGICAVLAETDVINMVSRGITVPNILRGIHESMATRFVKLLRGIKASGTVLITGGLSSDAGLLRAMSASADKQKSMKLTMRTADGAVYAGAIGAALWGAFRFERLQHRRAA